MADVIRKATNRFTKGMILDFSPENTKNEVLTNALNATLLTFNGNELSLQNDMGNGRVETAYLPEGYMPVGTCEYGGIIYIVSYNPLEDKSQIGCFPSPERNISSKELGKSDDVTIYRNWFQDFDTNGNLSSSGLIKHNSQYVLLKNDNLNPGDKFLVCANKDIYNEKLADLWVDKDSEYYEGSGKTDPKDFEEVANPVIALNVVSIEDSGKIVYLNTDVRKYEVPNSYEINGTQYTDVYKYHILGQMSENNGVYDQASVDPDNYRNVLSSGYSVFKSKTSGKLAILAELIMVDSYSVTHSLQPIKENDKIVEGAFDIIIHTDVSPEITKENYKTVPKLQYYYLENSQGYMQVGSETYSDKYKTLFTVNNGINTGIVNSNFLGTRLNEIYQQIPPAKLDLDNTLSQVGTFNFPRPYTYHGNMNPYDGNTSGTAGSSTHTKFIEGKFHRIKKFQVIDNLQYYKQQLVKFYSYNEEGKSYQEYEEKVIDEAYTYYIKKENHTYHDAKRDEAYKHQYLYKLETSAIAATEDEIRDITIEKFKYQEIHTYRPATNEDLESNVKLYYTNDGGLTYIQLTEAPQEGETYYVLKIEENLVSIGTVVDPNTVQGTIYYYPSSKSYVIATEEEVNKYYDFKQYPMTNTEPYGCPITLYWRQTEESYVEATRNELNNFYEYGITLYYSTQYTVINDLKSHDDSTSQLFMVVPMDLFVDSSKFVPDERYNWINGKTKPNPTVEYPKDDPIFLYTLSNFIPQDIPSNDDLIDSQGEYFKYKDVKLGNIQIPKVVSENGLDLSFKYDYTIVPCMGYGKLQHLAVSNTIDFSKLHAFNQSNFTQWRYRIDNNQLRLTFGAEVYDTYETYKVDGLILEFYDCWGYAGTLEILDKKSYSGVFTKIIPLNSLNALVNKRIINSNYSDEQYVRNINIQENKDKTGYTFNKESATYLGEKQGWSITKNTLSGEESDIGNNDCGTLYSNILYGVKAYLRRTTDKGYEFIKKKEYFLYTLPIYNDYYYSTTDFSYLTYPKLSLMLTYKLKDSGTKNPYTSDNILNGYNALDKANVDSYLGGFYNQTSLDLIRYYKYQGTTELYLEIGLTKDYENLNMSYHPDINNYYQCKLLLISDNDERKTFKVNSDLDGLSETNQILNYNSLIEEDVNIFGFDNTDSGSKSILSAFRSHNFINVSEDFVADPIKITYQFVVGYTASISDIRSTQVQATTVCALFHRTPSGEFNYEDFGVYEKDGHLMSAVMFYNEGTSTTEIFGICRQFSLEGNMTQQCQSVTSVETDAREIKTAGKLNTGNPLKQLVNHIGKLAFCQPHAHGLSELNGVNIHEGPNGGQYGIPPEVGGVAWGKIGDSKDDCWGIIPRNYFFEHPKFNMCLNTKDSINYNGLFESTLDWETIENGYVLAMNLSGTAKEDPDEMGGEWHTVPKMRKYTGFTGEDIVTFNTKMLKTMSSVYAYNPDYDSLTVKAGNINLQNYNPYFTSNLLNTYSSLNFSGNLTLNDFIYLGFVKFSDYLKQLSNFSKTATDSAIITYSDSPLPQVQFVPNFDYCGTAENYYMISTLTYNTPTPKELEQELEFSASNITVIKHTNGDNSFIYGTPNRKILYGYNQEFNKLIQLDVSNYTIQEDGTLVIGNEGAKETIDTYVDITPELHHRLFTGSISIDHTVTNAKEEEVSLNLNFSLSKSGKDSLFMPLQYGSDRFFMGLQYLNNYEGGKFILSPNLQVVNTSNNNDYKYNVKLKSIQLSCRAIALNTNEITLSSYPIPLTNQSAEALAVLTSGNEWQDVTLINSYGVPITNNAGYYWLNPHSYLTGNNINLNDVFAAITPDKDGNILFVFQPNINAQTNEQVLGLLEFKIHRIDFTVSQVGKLEITDESFITTTRTSKYATFINSKYTVDEDYNNARLRGSSITLNDLAYDPSQDGHRLFMRNGLCVQNPDLRGKLYYRSYGPSDEKNMTWAYDKTKYLNNLFIYTGPCYTSDNLNGTT